MFLKCDCKRGRITYPQLKGAECNSAPALSDFYAYMHIPEAPGFYFPNLLPGMLLNTGFMVEAVVTVLTLFMVYYLLLQTAKPLSIETLELFSILRIFVIYFRIMSSNRICDLFGIEYPIIQAGMVWCSGWRLASAVSNSGGLGLIGSGSMHPEILAEHIRKAKAATNKPFGVNIPLLKPDIEGIIKVIIDENVKIVFSSAGSPKKWTSFLKDHGIIVTHVVSSAAFAVKSEEAGVDAIVAEGFEAGGHDGREETTTITLIPSVRKATSLPLLAAGGIATGRAMLSAMILGADGVQIGSRFAVSDESSGHENFKKRVVDTWEGETYLTLKKLTPVRMIKNRFFEQVQEAENRCASIDELKTLLGRGRSKRGMFDGELDEGELEIGQVSSLIDNILPVSVIMKNLLDEYNLALADLHSRPAFKFDTYYSNKNELH